MKSLTLLLTLAVATPSFTAPAAAPLAPTFNSVIQLSDGLGYIRAHRVGESLDLLRSAITADSALIYDLRYAKANDNDAPALASVLTLRKSAAPFFILVSPATAPELTAILLSLPPHAVTVGIPESLPAPQINVTQSADADRQAYDALESGTTLEALINGKIEKERFDEAQLVKEFQNGNLNAAPPPEPDPSKSGTEKPAPLTDRVLQRAFHLQRALHALKP